MGWQYKILWLDIFLRSLEIGSPALSMKRELSASYLDFLSRWIVESSQSSSAPPLFLPPQLCHFVKFFAGDLVLS